MRKLSFLIFTALLGLGLALGDLSWVCAQEQEFTIEEITVTAQKRSENQQKVAIAMEVLSGDELKELGKSDIADILSNLSGVMFTKDSDGMRVSIRSVADDKLEMYAVPTTAPVVSLSCRLKT